MKEFTLEEYFHQLQELNRKKAIEEALDRMVEINELLGLYELDGKPNPLIKRPSLGNNVILGYN